MLDIEDVAAKSGLPHTQLVQWSRDSHIPKELWIQEGKRFLYAPCVLAFCELVVELRSILGVNSRWPVRLAQAATPRIKALWGTEIPEGAKLQIYADLMVVTISLDFLRIAQEKLHGVAA